ncbi:TRAP transporter small permease [Leptospira interrogans]
MSALTNFLFAACRVGAGVALVAMIAIVFGEIVSRNMFGVSLQLSEEVAGYLLVALCFLGFVGSYRSGDLMRIEMIYDLFPSHQRAIADILFDGIALVAVIIVNYFTSRFVWSSYTRGTVAPTLLETPLWIPQLFMPLGLSILAVALVCRMIENAVAMQRGA